MEPQLDRNTLVIELLEAACAEIESTHYPEGVSPAARNLALKRMALVPTPLLASGKQNILNLVLWACAETELEIAGVYEPEIEDRFDSVSERPNQNTSGKCELLLVGDIFLKDENSIYAIVTEVKNDRIFMDFVKDTNIETLDMPRDLMAKMLDSRGYKRLT